MNILTANAIAPGSPRSGSLLTRGQGFVTAHTGRVNTNAFGSHAGGEPRRRKWRSDEDSWGQERPPHLESLKFFLLLCMGL